MDIMPERALETIPKKHGAIKELADALGIAGNSVLRTESRIKISPTGI